MSLWAKHEIFEKYLGYLLIGALLTVSIGGLVEIMPLFWLKSTIEPVKGIRPYTPLELAGRGIYLREGCYGCHSQMIRTLRDEVERYGHYSLAAESLYDHPFQWGSKRTGPDLARVGGRYTDDWHVRHLNDPRAVVPESIMPAYGFLSKTPLELKTISAQIQTHRALGVPYTQEMIKYAVEDAKTQASIDETAIQALHTRYPNVIARKFNEASGELTEMDALVAYLQMLGTLVDFKTYAPTDENLR
jgi:cytochrome c oxidase cbb3-type subunit II